MSVTRRVRGRGAANSSAPDPDAAGSTNMFAALRASSSTSRYFLPVVPRAMQGGERERDSYEYVVWCENAK
jgi:hypothetical protein